MQHKKRRRLDLIFNLALAGLCAGVTLLIAFAGDEERVAAYWAMARVDSDGDAQVTEVLDYDFGPESRHGIYRDVPGLDGSARVRASSPTAPADVALMRENLDVRIRIGNRNSTVRGRHRYQIEYPVGVRFGERGVSWNAVGTRWRVGIRDVELHLVAEHELEDVHAMLGRHGSTWEGASVEHLAPGHVVVRADELAPGHGITVDAQLGAKTEVLAPEPPSGAAVDPGVSPWFLALSVLVAFLLASVFVTQWVRRAGREMVWGGGSVEAAYGPRTGDGYTVRRMDHDELGAMAATEFVPPKELRSWQGGVLLTEGTKAEHRVAWLLERAIRGDIEIEGSGKELRLRREAARGDGHETDPLDTMFGGRDEVELGSYDVQFAAGWKLVDAELRRWHDDSGLWDPEGDTRRRSVRVWAILGILASILLLAFTTVQACRWGYAWMPGVVLAGAALGGVLCALLRSHELRIRTPEGSGLWIRTESFRRFLEKSDAQHVEKAARLGYLREYSAWAVALDEVDSWTKAVEAAGLEQSVDAGHYHFVHMAPALSMATSAAATAPSSSGGGGGGGGFVGGGGGGGGGGSW